MHVAFFSWFKSDLKEVLVGLEPIGMSEATIVKVSVSLAPEKFIGNKSISRFKLNLD